MKSGAQVTTWYLVFFKNDRKGWYRFVPGRFKHVAAFGFEEEAKVWVIYDCHLTGTHIGVMPDSDAAWITLRLWTENASILLTHSRHRNRFWRLGLYCVPAIAHLVGVPGAVIPAGLWRSCLRNGAVIIKDGRQ